MSKVSLEGIDYLGCDIVAPMIEANAIRYRQPNVKFEARSIFEPIRKSDLILCRDLLFHFSNEWVLKAIRNVKASGTRWFLTTTFQDKDVVENEDINVTLGYIAWRKINLFRPPFFMPSPERIIQEKDNHACQGRIVALFDMEKWRG
jgi:hypothetical protein